MAGDEDIEKLLREIDAMNAGGRLPAPQPDRAITGRGAAAVGPAGAGGRQAGAGEAGSGRTGSSEVVPAGRSARMRWTGVSAVGGLAAGGFAGTVLTFLPSVGTLSTALGAALGAAAAGLVSGPPAWFSRRR